MSRLLECISKPRVILLVDDDENDRSIFKHYTKSLFIVILEAATGTEALNILSERSDIDLVVLDVHMPGMDGKEVFRTLKLRGDKRTVIFWTGHPGPIGDAVEDAGMAFVVSKPKIANREYVVELLKSFGVVNIPSETTKER